MLIYNFPGDRGEFTLTLHAYSGAQRRRLRCVGKTR